MLGHRLLLLLQMLLIVMATSTSNVLADLPLPAATTLPQNESSYYLDGTGQASDAVLISEQDSYYVSQEQLLRIFFHSGANQDYRSNWLLSADTRPTTACWMISMVLWTTCSRIWRGLVSGLITLVHKCNVMTDNVIVVKVGANKCERMHCAGAGNSAW